MPSEVISRPVWSATFCTARLKVADQTGLEITSQGIYQIFEQEYLSQTAPYAYVSHKMVEDSSSDEPVQIDIGLLHNKASMSLQGGGNGPIDAFVDALGLDVTLMDYHEHAIGHGANAKAACYVELRLDGGPTLFGAGVDSNIVTASFKAVLSAINRQIAQKIEAEAGISQAAA